MSTQTQLPQPTLKGSNLSKIDYLWMLLVQLAQPLIAVDTSGGDVVIPLPTPGIDTAGQTAQNQLLLYIKTSADANTITITGGQGGSVVLGAQYAVAGFKSDATDWWPILVPSSGGGSPIVATYENLGWSASFGPETVYTPAQSGLYLVSVYVAQTADVGTVGGESEVYLNFTDDVTSYSDQIFVSFTDVMTIGGSNNQFGNGIVYTCEDLYLEAGEPLQVGVTYASNGTYNLHAQVSKV